MEHYNVAEWQPYLIVAALGAGLIALGIAALIVQLVVSVRHRNEALDLTGDPWDGRTLEWLTSSPPAPYNFAVVPEVRESDAFHEMKRRGVAYQRPAHYTDIVMPRNTGIGVIIGGLAFVARLRHGLAHLVAGDRGRPRHPDRGGPAHVRRRYRVRDARGRGPGDRGPAPPGAGGAPTHVDEHAPVRDAALARGVT